MTRSAREIEADIEATRRRLESRLDRLGDEFHPTNLVSSALGTDGREGTGEMLSAVAHRARQNPLGTGLVVAGLAAMFFGRNQAREDAYVGPYESRDMDPALARNKVHANPAYAAPYDRNLPTYDGERGMPRHPGDPADRVAEDIHALKAQKDALAAQASGRADELSRQAGDAVDAVRDTVSGAVESVKDAVSSAYDTVTGKADETYRRASLTAEEYRREARYRTERAKMEARRAPVVARARAEQAVDWVRENPVPAGLMALALGATVASILAPKSQPRSRYGAARELYEDAREEETNPRSISPIGTAAATKAVVDEPAPRARSTAAARTAKPKVSKAKAASSARGAVTSSPAPKADTGMKAASSKPKAGSRAAGTASAPKPKGSDATASASSATSSMVSPTGTASTGDTLNGSTELRRSTSVLGSPPAAGTNPPANG